MSVGGTVAVAFAIAFFLVACFGFLARRSFIKFEREAELNAPLIECVRFINRYRPAAALTLTFICFVLACLCVCSSEDRRLDAALRFVSAIEIAVRIG
jgi:NADH:ubiquinone oxidoreductase subunit K